MANSADPEKPTDLDLHYLQRQGISGFIRTRVYQANNITKFHDDVSTNKVYRFLKSDQYFKFLALFICPTFHLHDGRSGIKQCTCCQMVRNYTIRTTESRTLCAIGFLRKGGRQ